MTTLEASMARRLTVLTAAAGLVAAALVTTAAATAGDRRPDFPLSVADAKDRAEARFQSLDADGSGELSPAELAAGDFPGRRGPGLGHHFRFKAPFDGERPERAALEERLGDMDAELFAALDSNADGLLAKDEFSTSRLHDARMAQAQERLFARLDRDDSGGVSRDELPDMSRWLEAMDTDDDGVVTRAEARVHRQHRHAADDDAADG